MRQTANRPRREKPWLRTRVVLPRPGVSEEDTAGSNWRGMVFPLGDITDPNVQRGYRRVCTAGVGLFSGAARPASYDFPPASAENSRRETPGSDSQIAPEAWCSRKETLQAQRAEDWCSQKGTLKTHKCSTRRPTGWHCRFGYFSGAVRVYYHVSRQRAKTIRAETPGVRICVVLPRAGVPGRGRCRTKFQHDV